MSDLIDRGAAIDALCDNCNHTQAACPFYPCVQYIALRGLPSAEPERKRGEWKPFDLTWGRSIYFCTACNDATEIPTFDGKPMYKFCPNCGAAMKGEQNG